MLSRVAESIYWMSRYVERAENVSRFVDVNLHLLLDLPDDFEGQWGALVQITGDNEDFEKRYETADDASVIRFLTFDRENPSSIVSCVQAARENARSVREVITSETWEALNELYIAVTASGAEKAANDNPHEFFRDVRKACHLLEGVTSETMLRGEPWHFSRLGRLIERADQTTRILDIKYFLLLPDVSYVGSPIDDLHWTAVLRSASALDAYRRTHGRAISEAVLRFLLLDRDFPRSTLFCLAGAEESLHCITGTPNRSFRNLAERRLGQLVAELDYTEEREIIQGGLHEYLDSIQAKISGVGECIYDTFFALKPLRP